MLAAVARVGLLFAVLASVACAPAPVTSQSPSGERPSEAPRTLHPKLLVLAASKPVTGFGLWDINEAYGAASVVNIHAVGLSTQNPAGALEGRLAAAIPSLDDGTIVVLPDGRMQTTWKLRPDIRWHDGAPFSADDLAFTWQIVSDPGVPGNRTAAAQNIESVVATDPQTAIITWKTTFYRALYLDVRDFWPLPRHILADAFERDKPGFQNLPYWTTQFAHLGPFRMVDFGLGETLVFERFDSYFLGRPRLDRITIKIIPDPNTVFANLQAGAVDIATENGITLDMALRLRDEWQRSGAGVAVARQGNFWTLKVQFDPEWGKPAELSRDVRIRQGLYTGLDREVIQETLFPGSPEASADTFMAPSDPRAQIVGRPFARYQYSPTAAAQLLVTGGWHRVGDGRAVNASSEPVQLAVRGSPSNRREVAIAADHWRQLGLEVIEDIDSPALAGVPEHRASFPGLVGTARGFGDRMFLNFDSRLTPSAQNRFAGQNQGGYANPAMDRLIDRLYASIRLQDQAVLLKEMGEILATDLPAFPVYFGIEMMLVPKGIRALTDDYATAESATAARNAHLWDRD